MRLLIVTALLACWSGQAATFTAASTSRTDVLAKINLCSSGDTVNIPTGTSVWASPIAITNAITLNGNGTNNTHIQNSQSAGTGYANSLLNINLTAGEASKTLTIQNISFEATANPSGGGVVGISSDGATTWPTQIRITQCYFTKFNFALVPYWFGVCDHCVFYNNRDCVRWPCVALGDLPGSPPYAWNSANWFFCEDCNFTQDAGQTAWQYINMDSEGPSCQAVRYSTYNINNPAGAFYQLFDMHGSGNCGGQSVVGILSYKNQVNATAGSTIQFVDIRGGSGSLCYSNICTASAYTTVRTDPVGSVPPANTFVWNNRDTTGDLGGTPPGSFAQFTYPHPLVSGAPAAPANSGTATATTVRSGNIFISH